MSELQQIQKHPARPGTGEKMFSDRLGTNMSIFMPFMGARTSWQQ